MVIVMAGRNNKKYRGRRAGGASVALKVIVALLAVLLVAAILFTLIMGDYVEYTDEGVKYEFIIPEGCTAQMKLEDGREKTLSAGTYIF